MDNCNCACFTFDIIEEPVELTFEITEGTGGGLLPFYDGPYSVEPRKIQQTLATKNKSMSNDVTVNDIYYSEVSNITGGITCYIGKE